MNFYRSHASPAVVVAFFVLTSGSAEAQYPPVCVKKKLPLTQCEVTPQLSNNSTCAGALPCSEEAEEGGLCTGGGNAPWEDYLTYNEERYSEVGDIGPEGSHTTAFTEPLLREACHEYALKAKAANLPLYAAWNDGDVENINQVGLYEANCMIDRSIPPDGDADDIPNDQTGTVELVWLTPDPHCYATPTGPYSRPLAMRDGGDYDADFPDGFYRIRRLWDQYEARGLPTTANQPWITDGGVWREPTFASAYDPARANGLEHWVELGGKENNRQPSFHHVIPRVDSQGCACGSNAQENLAVVSVSLNSSMKNNIRHPALRALLQKYTTWTP